MDVVNYPFLFSFDRKCRNSTDSYSGRHYRGLITFHLVLFLVVQTWVEPRKKEALFSQLSGLVQESFERDRVALREELEPIKEQLRPLLSSSASATASTTPIEDLKQGSALDQDWVPDVESPIEDWTPQETALVISGFYLNNPSFLQGLIVGSTASLLGFFLLSR